MQTSAKIPDGSDIGKTPIKRMHHGGFVTQQHSYKKIFLDMTVTSTEYKHQKINMWPKTFRGDHEIYQ